MFPRAIPTRRQAYASCVLAALTLAGCAGLMTAATLTPAPVGVLPLVIAVCIGCPLVMAWSLPLSILVLRAGEMTNAEERALSAMRRHLARLPETPHPLGF